MNYGQVLPAIGVKISHRRGDRKTTNAKVCRGGEGDRIARDRCRYREDKLPSHARPGGVERAHRYGIHSSWMRIGHPHEAGDWIAFQLAVEIGRASCRER